VERTYVLELRARRRRLATATDGGSSSDVACHSVLPWDISPGERGRRGDGPSFGMGMPGGSCSLPLDRDATRGMGDTTCLSWRRRWYGPATCGRAVLVPDASGAGATIPYSAPGRRAADAALATPGAGGCGLCYIPGGTILVFAA